MEKQRKPTGHYDKNGRMIFDGDALAVDIHPTAYSKAVVSINIGLVFWDESDKSWRIGSAYGSYRLNEHPSCDLQVVK